MLQTTEANTTRRNFLAGTAVVASTAAIAASPSASAAATSDGELLLLEIEIDRLYAEARHINDTVVKPLESGLMAIQNNITLSPQERIAAALEYDETSGRAAAIDRGDEAYRSADSVVYRMWSIPATSDIGRAAKVRVLIRHIMGKNWRGPDVDLDWEISLCRQLLLLLSGMTEADLLRSLEGA